MLLGSSSSNIAVNSTFARPLDFACRLSPSFHAFAEACATETLGAYLSGNQTSGWMDSGDISPEITTEKRRGRARLENRHTALSGKQRIHQTFSWRQRIALIGGLFPRSLRPTDGSGASGSPFLESRSSSVGQFDLWFRNSDLQSEFSLLSYSYWQNMMQCCIILTVNLLTWRKVSPVFYWKSEPFIPAHDNSARACVIFDR